MMYTDRVVIKISSFLYQVAFASSLLLHNFALAQDLVLFDQHFDGQSPLIAGVNYEVEKSSRLRIVRDPIKRSNRALEINIKGRDLVARKNRAEIRIESNEKAGEEYTYEWRFLIPSNFANYPTSLVPFNIIGQWKDQPDTSKGETWDDIRSNTPTIAMFYGERGSSSGISISYGLKDVNRRVIVEQPIKKGSWVSVKAHIRWSTEDDGFIEIFINDKPATAFNGIDYKQYGVNMYPRGMRFKLGLYRGERGQFSKFLSLKNRILLDDIKITKLEN